VCRQREEVSFSPSGAAREGDIDLLATVVGGGSDAERTARSRRLARTAARQDACRAKSGQRQQ
jgi:hypothetical protein